MSKHRGRRKKKSMTRAARSRRAKLAWKKRHRGKAGASKRRRHRRKRNTNPFAFLAGFQTGSPVRKKSYGSRAAERLARMRARRYHGGSKGYSSGYAQYAAGQHAASGAMGPR